MSSDFLRSQGSRWPDVHALQDRFPSVTIRVISGILIEARRSVDMFGLTPAAEDEMVEKIAFQQLLQLTGEAPDMARLDPESHNKRPSYDEHEPSVED